MARIFTCICGKRTRNPQTINASSVGLNIRLHGTIIGDTDEVSEHVCPSCAVSIMAGLRQLLEPSTYLRHVWEGARTDLERPAGSSLNQDEAR
jgi:type II secretory pathway component PulC